MRIRHVVTSLVTLAATLGCALVVEAKPAVEFAPSIDESANFQVETLLADLDNPTGLALRPTLAKRGPYELFVAESGAGRVIRVATNTPQQVDEVVVDFPLGTFGSAPKYRVGPLDLGFITRSKLIVSAKGAGPGADALAGYSLSGDGETHRAADRSYSVGPLGEKIASQVDDLQLGGLVIDGKTCFITTGGQAEQGWILKSGIEANRLAYLQPFVELQKKVGFGGPSGIAVVPRPRPAFLVVGLMGSRSAPQDSRLAFFVPSSGEPAMNLPTGLNDIISLAYSPTGQLYAADFSWHDEQAGGVYRIDDVRIDGRQTCRAVKIVSLVRPFALAFAPDGSLFVTAFGAGENTKQGSLVKITGEL